MPYPFIASPLITSLISGCLGYMPPAQLPPLSVQQPPQATAYATGPNAVAVATTESMGPTGMSSPSQPYPGMGGPEMMGMPPTMSGLPPLPQGLPLPPQTQGPSLIQGEIPYGNDMIGSMPPNNPYGSGTQSLGIPPLPPGMYSHLPQQMNAATQELPPLGPPQSLQVPPRGMPDMPIMPPPQAQSEFSPPPILKQDITFVQLFPDNTPQQLKPMSQQNSKQQTTTQSKRVTIQEKKLSAQKQVNTQGKPSVQAQNVQDINIRASNYSFDPAQITVKKGKSVRITFDVSSPPHSFRIDELGVNKRLNNSTETLEFTPNRTGNFTFYCDVGDHRSRGMRGTITVTD
jgi:plastocyanin